jgi:Na+-translocating ferredoxin:NAD+ oxidoreductase RnfA subunit
MQMLGIPWAAALIYAGFAEFNFYIAAAVGVLIGAVLYASMRSRMMLANLQRSPFGAVAMLLITQLITVSLLYGIGYLFS